MEKQLFKVLGKDITEILAVNKLNKVAVVRAVKEDVTAFVLVKMISLTKPLLNKDGVEDSKIFKDLYEYSSGQINLNETEIHLHEFKEIASPSNNKKKKKK